MRAPAADADRVPIARVPAARDRLPADADRVPAARDRLPAGADRVPADGSLPASALDGLGTRPLGVYVHVPYCATRCGYCDFNTYTSAELPGGGQRDAFAGWAIEEVRLARRVLGPQAPPVQTVFFGGGTPTLLPPRDLAAILEAVGDELGLAPGAEITTEANPESVDARSLAVLRGAGFTRVSFGMQSSSPAVLGVLERTHTPGRPAAAVAEARAAGFEHVSLDLIYGTPGETDDEWRASVEAALAAEPDHVSAYGLVVEPGTRLAAQVRRGDLPAPDDDVMAERYLMADAALGAAGLHWYEVCSWAADDQARCRHNLNYWRGADWWGIGPGAHSHVGGTRWWNVLHPSAYAARLAAGQAPGAGREVLGAQARRFERIMLELRLASGLDVGVLDEAGCDAAARLAEEGLVTLARGRVTLTLRGRLLADAAIRALTG